MSTDLERRLADVLQRRADEAMAGTDTQARHGDLLRELRDETSGPAWRTWTAGVAAAAAAAAVVAVSVPSVLPSRTNDGDAPAGEPETPAVRVASEFFDAFRSFDRERAASYLAEDADLQIWVLRSGEDAWRRGNRWLEAAGWDPTLLSCEQTGTSALGTYVECAFDYHALHSEQLGRGPYVGALFRCTVDEGEIVAARMSGSSPEFGEEMWDPFAEWLNKTYPDQAAVMYEEPEQEWESLHPRSIELWRELSLEWAQEQQVS